jgi:Helix-turn-helix domain
MSIAVMSKVWQLRLKSTIKLVLMALADAADDDGNCWPSVPTLARKTCMDERSVQRILKYLKENTFIEINPRYRTDGSPTSNGYRILLANTGDNLSPPFRKKCHEVVAQVSPGDGTAVTLTTREPLINQKQLPQLRSKTLEATSGSEMYVFPNQLKPQECKLARLQLDTIDQVLAQAVLDELAARLNANKITGAPLSYLRSLITRAKIGQFTPEAGIRVASAREQAKSAQLKKTAEVIKPCDPSDVPKHLAAMHQVLGGKSARKLNQED